MRGWPCWLCQSPTRRETWRHHHTGALLAVVDHCPACHSTRGAEPAPDPLPQAAA